MKTGGEILIGALDAQGVTHIFGVPGESYLAALDALHDSPIEMVSCRQEGGAAIMADAVGKLTGRPGVCFVTRGPGATNASAGVHIASQDSTPMVLLIGQVGRDMRDREAFQEVDYTQMFGSMAKSVAEIDDPARIPEYVNRAFVTAMAGRPGPVVLSLPEDMLREPAAVRPSHRAEPVEQAPTVAQMERLQALLDHARRPFAILGGARWDENSIADVRDFIERFDLPVSCSFRRQGLFDHEHPNYAGELGLGPNPALAARVKEADVLLLIGGRLGELPTTGYTLIDHPVPEQTLVHVHAGAEEIGKVYASALGINASPAGFAEALAGLTAPSDIPWAGSVKAAHDAYVAWTSQPRIAPGNVQMAEIITWLSQNLPDDAIVCNGAGNYSAWIGRFYRYRRFATQLGPVSGSMGYGMPAAVAAKMTYPDREVVALAGDGCFMMHGQELATAVQQGLDMVMIVVNNGMYGTIRMHQERDYPGRVSGTALNNPDFAALARAYGAHGECVETTEDFAPAFERCRKAGGPALIELVIDPEALTPNFSLAEIREGTLSKS